MKSVALVSKQGRQYKATLPDPKPDLVSAYIFAFAKSGSTLLSNMVEAYCKYMNVPTFSLFNTAFDQGVNTHDIQEDAAIFFKPSGYIYTGFRHFPAFNLNLTDAPVIWLTRDPRDMLVSRYYSILKSHVIPKGLESLEKTRKDVGKLDINQYALKTASSFATAFQRYKKMLVNCDLKIYRYEDVIYKKEEWLTDVVSRLGLKQHPEHIGNLARHFDVIPEFEDENEHIRQVHPGNHLKKLSHQTICELNNTLADFLDHFNYEH